MNGEEGLDSDSVVLIGSFNPSLVQPKWLEAQGLFEGREIDVRDVVITRPVTMLNLGWLVAELTENRAAFQTTVESTTSGLLRDFVADLFRILEHTPVSALGMNRLQHFSLPEGGWDRLIGKLAPADALDDALTDAETTSLTWRAPRRDDLDGNRTLTLQPSEKLPGGAWMSWNSHVELGEDRRALDGVGVLEERWDDERRAAGSLVEFFREAAI